MRDLNGKVAFVTGGASGIGLGIVEALLDRGVRVMVADLREDHLCEVKERFGDRSDVRTIKVDVIDRDAAPKPAPAAPPAR